MLSARGVVKAEACKDYQPLSPDGKVDASDKTMQNVTFVISILVQIGSLVLSAVAYSKKADELPGGIRLILTLEFVVNVIQLVWYLSTALLVGCSMNNSPLYSRYIDWMCSTPIMLVNLLCFINYFDRPCSSQGDVFDHPSFLGTDTFDGHGRAVAATIYIVIFLWLMLWWGLMDDFSAPDRCVWPKFTAMFEGLFSWKPWGKLDESKSNPASYHVIRAFGFVLLTLAFIPLFMQINLRYTDEGLAVLLITYFVWLGYGLVWQLVDLNRIMVKNACYNLLDCASKNAFSILVSIIVLSKDFYCTPPSSPPPPV